MRFDNRPAQIVSLDTRRPFDVTLRDLRRRSTTTRLTLSARCTQRCRTVILLAQVHGSNYGLVNGNARCFMRGIHRIEPVTDRLPTSGHEKAHPPCHPSSAFSLRTRSTKLTLACSAGRLSGEFRGTSLEMRRWCLTQGTAILSQSVSSTWQKTAISSVGII